jgi:hypothetical protein
MLTVPTHTFGPNKEYTVKRFTVAGERKIMRAYAKALADAGQELSGILETVDGGTLYMQAVLTECLLEAPEHWWQDTTQGGRAVTFEVYPEEFAYVAREVNAWLNSFRLPDPPRDLDAGDHPTEPVAVAEAISAPFTGRAS